jgi:hypothetical protein
MNKPGSGVHKVPTDHAARRRILELVVSSFGRDLFLPTESSILVLEVTLLIIFGERGEGGDYLHH